MLCGVNRTNLVIAAALALIAIVAQAMGAAPLLRYERAAVNAGELWRLVTGNLVHLDWPHLGLNLAGLVMVLLLFTDRFRGATLLLALAATGTGVGVGLHLLSPAVHWYVGLSGALHGLFATGAVLQLTAARERMLAVLLLAGLALKLIGERYLGQSLGATFPLSGPVVVDAHLYGAVSGAALGAVLLGIAEHRRKKQGPPVGGP
jgi:rhomboid family GlyGly-CTERM serine protease